MNDTAQPRITAPQVRTLLLTDLCDSTSLVERLGDAPAANLFREHDRLVLELQQRWRGRLIDRSDGLLLLFERPVDALGFALDYNRGLRELGATRNLTLQARAGLHVGEVLTWRNSDAAVQAGAKPLEVEGLAKPLAGRLMTLARPGQILLSATAEPLARRAARELGERSDHLIWKSHGRWRLKGVPDTQEIYEVGEPGYAPLRAPKQNHAKAWRDIPLWRRPAALAAEIFLLVGMGTGVWFITRPQPAIAFAERDWVVVGDLRNLTGQPVLDESLEQAFRISLEQSRYVNVLSDLKVRDTLALMKRQPETALDRAIASEIAIRDGARAVILPTVAEVGGRVRVSAEVIDPHTQTTVYAESADGVGAVSTLDSIDRVTGELREKLGEAIAAIERDSAPLPQVSTANLDALKAYALGNKQRAKGNDKEALAFYQRAVEFDPKFALAILSVGRMHGKLRDLPAARRELDRAAKLRERLSGREALLLDAHIANYGPIELRLQRWQQLLAMYPDSYEAHFAIAQDGMLYANRYAAGLPHAKAASVPQYERQALAIYLQGMIQLGMEHHAEAIKAFQRARAKNYKGAIFRSIYPYAAKREWAMVDRLMSERRSSGVSTAELEVPYNQMLFALDRGRWRVADAASNELVTKAEEAEPLVAVALAKVQREAVRGLLSTEATNGMADRLLSQLDATRTAQVRLQPVHPAYDEIMTLALGYLGARIDAAPVVRRALADVETSRDLPGYPLLVQMREVLLAEQDRLAGKRSQAVDRLQKLVDREEAMMPAHSALMRAARTDGRAELALREARWLASHRGRAYSEMSVDHLVTVLNIADTTLAELDAAELLVQLGRKDEARKHRDAFLAAWPDNDRPEGIARRLRSIN